LKIGSYYHYCGMLIGPKILSDITIRPPQAKMQVAFRRPESFLNAPLLRVADKVGRRGV